MPVVSFVLSGILFMALITAIPLQLRIRYLRSESDDHVSILFKGFFGLLHYQFKVPFLDWRWLVFPHLRLSVNAKPSGTGKVTVEDEIKPRRVNFRLIINVLPNLWSMIHRLLEVKRLFYKGIRCKQLRCELEIGFTDAAHTGLAVGGMWSILGYYLGKLHNNITFEVDRPQVAVKPSFRQACFNADIDCIFKLRIGHIIVAGFKVLKILKLGLKGVKQ